MATTSRKRSRPGIAIIGLLAVIGLLFGIMAGTKTWAPKLGLDLQGGMTITLTATNPTVSQESLDLAVSIIQQRVDGMGVGEASVTTMGDRNIIVSAPNVSREDLVELVGATAQLEFRQVFNATPVQPGEEDSKDDSKISPLPRPEGDKGKVLPVDQVLAYQPSNDDNEGFQEYQCTDDPTDVLDQSQVVCDDIGATKYLLGPVAVQGKNVTNARAEVPQNDVGWVVSLEFDNEGTSRFGKITQALVSKPEPTNMFAIVLDGKVRSAARVNTPIMNGQAQISGQFTPEEAGQLANVLKFGSLPLNFEPSQVESVSPTLGGEQLRVGLIAGALGLAIVAIYALFYYRGLGLVVLMSLGLAGVTTYVMMTLLGTAVGFTLSLPAIAGAIVGVAVTADAFIIYFERIRDEIREGRSLRSSLESGWKKARSTIFVANAVQILAAIVLYILAVGGVQGFAFSLGLTTFINLVLVVCFTKPLVTLLGRTKFFGEGHRLSGLSPDKMGVSRERLLGRRTKRKEA